MNFTAKLLALMLFASCTFAQSPSGIPPNPKFKSVRIGGITKAECEAVTGAGQCGLAVEQKSYHTEDIYAPALVWEDDLFIQAVHNDLQLFANDGQIILAVINDIAPEIVITDAAVALTGAITVNGAALPSETSGTFTASFDTACTTTPTIVFDWVKHGNVVTLMADSTSGFTCTGDSNQFRTTGTPVPAAIRPVHSGGATTAIWAGFMTNAALTLGVMNISTGGDIGFRKCAGVDPSNDCASFTTWANTGMRNAAIGGNAFTYLLTNP